MRRFICLVAVCMMVTFLTYIKFGCKGTLSLMRRPGFFVKKEGIIAENARFEGLTRLKDACRVDVCGCLYGRIGFGAFPPRERVPGVFALCRTAASEGWNAWFPLSGGQGCEAPDAGVSGAYRGGGMSGLRVTRTTSRTLCGGRSAPSFGCSVPDRSAVGSSARCGPSRPAFRSGRPLLLFVYSSRPAFSVPSGLLCPVRPSLSRPAFSVPPGLFLTPVPSVPLVTPVAVCPATFFILPPLGRSAAGVGRGLQTEGKNLGWGNLGGGCLGLDDA